MPPLPATPPQPVPFAPQQTPAAPLATAARTRRWPLILGVSIAVIAVIVSAVIFLPGVLGIGQSGDGRIKLPSMSTKPKALFSANGLAFPVSSSKADQNLVFVKGEQSNEVYVFDVATQQRVWTNKEIRASSAKVSEGLALFLTKGTVTALDARTGKELSQIRANTDESIGGFWPLSTGQIVIVTEPAMSSSFAALSSITVAVYQPDGKQSWRKQVQLSSEAKIQGDPGKRFFGGPINKDLFMVDVASNTLGAPVFSVATGDTPPDLRDGISSYPTRWTENRFAARSGNRANGLYTVFDATGRQLFKLTTTQHDLQPALPQNTEPHDFVLMSSYSGSYNVITQQAKLEIKDELPLALHQGHIISKPLNMSGKPLETSIRIARDVTGKELWRTSSPRLGKLELGSSACPSEVTFDGSRYIEACENALVAYSEKGVEWELDLQHEKGTPFVRNHPRGVLVYGSGSTTLYGPA